MANKHETTTLDRARDELYSHIHRCDVLEAREEEQHEWLEETMEFMKERYPDLEKMEVAKLEVLGRRFCQPIIPHGKGNTAISRQNDTESSDTENTKVEPVAAA